MLDMETSAADGKGDPPEQARRLALKRSCVCIAALAAPGGGLCAAPVPPSPSSAASAALPALTLRSAAQAGAPVKYAPADPVRPGICAEIAAAVQRADPQLHLQGLDQQIPLRRLELMLSTDELDVFFCLLRSPRRLQLMRFLTVPLYRVRHVLAMRAADPRTPQTWDELRAFSRRSPLSVAQGSQLVVTLQQAGVSYAEAARSDQDALQMLVRSRVDAVYGQDLSLRQAVRGSDLEQQVRLGPQIFEEEIQYAAVSRRLPPAAADRLSERLRQLVAAGELSRIVERYR